MTKQRDIFRKAAVFITLERLSGFKGIYATITDIGVYKPFCTNIWVHVETLRQLQHTHNTYLDGNGYQEWQS